MLGLGDRRVARGVAPALVLLLACSAMAGGPAAADAQETARPAPVVATVPDSLRDHTPGIVTGALLGTMGGGLGGALLGYQFETGSSSCGGDYCGLGGFLLGAAVGSTLMTPILAHAMGGKRGDLSAGILVTALASVAIVGVSTQSDALLGVLWITFPLTHVLTAVLMEKRTARPRR